MPPPEPSEPQKKKPTRFIPDDSFLEGSPVKDAFLLFIQYRKKIRKTLNTQMSYQNCHKNLMKLSGGDPDKAFEIVNNSISNGYQGIFPLKYQDDGPSTKFERQARAQQQLISSVSQQCADRIRAEQTSREGSGEGGFVPPEI